MKQPYRLGIGFVLALMLSACGGGGGNGSNGGGGGGAGGGGGGGTAPATELNFQSFEMAQTHVLPESGKSWTLRDGSGAISAEESLHFTSRRAALILASFTVNDAINPVIQGLVNGVVIGGVALAPPNQLPGSEDGGPAYGNDLYSASIPSSWMQPGLQLRANADNYLLGTARSPEIGAEFPFTLRVLPFYLFGANDANTQAAATVTNPSTALRNEMFAKWPISSLALGAHPAGRYDLPYLVVAPRNDRSGTPQPAYVANSLADYRDGFAGLATTLGILSGLHSANGEDRLPVQYYGPVLQINAAGQAVGPGGGVGGGSDSTGDTSYAGIFIHEVGHAFGQPHAGEAFDAFRYPYEWGSLKGSAWGFDQMRNEFLSPLVPPSSGRFASCTSDTFAGRARAFDNNGNCVRQDPMQSGAGDRGSSYQYSLFSDYNTAIEQRWFEGRTRLEADGSHSYSGGKVLRDSSFADGYKRWDALDRRFVNFDPATTQGGIFGLDQGLPVTFNTQVYAITVTISNAGTAGATQIYPPLRFIGNLRRSFDPTDANDRAEFVPDTSTNFWYCRNGGCDYTLRVNYLLGPTRHFLIQGGFRPFNQPRGTPAAATTDPLSGSSFKRFTVNIPDEGTIQSIQLLSTPEAWNGVGLLPPVLASR